MANSDGLYTNQGNGLWANNNQIIGITRALAFSTTTPLGANAVYTSPTIEGMNYKLIFIRAISDVSGGLVVQHSDDGVIWDSQTSNAVGNSLFVLNSNPLYGRYFRVVYTNGATIQTIFHMSSYLSPL